MKTIPYSVLIFFFFMGLGIFATPANDLMEITAQLCQLSDHKGKCVCLQEREETVLFLKKYRFDKN